LKKIIDFIDFSLKINSTILKETYCKNIITLITTNTCEFKALTPDEEELIRLIKLYVLHKNFNEIGVYVDCIYNTIIEYTNTQKYGISIANFTKNVKVTFNNPEILAIVDSQHNMLSVFITFTILHCLSSSNFNIFSKKIDGHTPNIFNEKILKKSQATVQSIITNIVNRIDIFFKILNIFGISTFLFDEKF